MYIIDPSFVQALILLYPYPSEAFILLIPYLIEKESLIAPVAISWSKISPEVEAEAIVY